MDGVDLDQVQELRALLAKLRPEALAAEAERVERVAKLETEALVAEAERVERAAKLEAEQVECLYGATSRG